MKADIVGETKKKPALRALLNLGHLWPAIGKTGMGYGAPAHGEAVAAGMVLAAETLACWAGSARRTSPRSR